MVHSKCLRLVGGECVQNLRLANDQIALIVFGPGAGNESLVGGTELW